MKIRSRPEPNQITKELRFNGTKTRLVYGIPEHETGETCLILAHGVRSSMNASNITYFHTGLARRGFLTVKFNFPFAEKRWPLIRKKDPRWKLVECYRHVVEEARKSEWRPKRFFLGGVSLGAAVASHVPEDEKEEPDVKGLFFLSYPIHLPRRPEALGDSHLSKIRLPMLFVSGNKDVYAQEATLKTRVALLGPKARLQIIEADHSFNRRKGPTVYRETLDKIVKIIDAWARSH